MSDMKRSFGEELAQHFVGGEEIHGGWKMNFLFPNGVKVGLGHVDNEAFFETIEPDGSRIVFEGIRRDALRELFLEAMNRKVKEGAL